MQLNKKRAHPTLCLTHKCNLSCIYCYQKHDAIDMSFEIAKKCIDDVFENLPIDCEDVEISLIGGEPLIKFDLIKKIFEYTNTRYGKIKHFFFATTNGTLLTVEMKKWFYENKKQFILGLSLDGTPEVQNYNRSNSFDKIDIDFFTKTWPNQGVKMTLSDFSLTHLAECIKYLHGIGINNITGVNLFESSFNWNDEKYIRILIPQLKEMVDFYSEHNNLQINQMLNKQIEFCANKPKIRQKYCGIGTGTIFYDVDGIKRPCAFCTPMTFDNKTLNIISKTDFNNVNNFIDDNCFQNCYIQPICSSCYGNNYLNQGSFKKKNKSKCRIQKLIVLFAADLLIKRILRNPDKYTDLQKVKILTASKKIKELIYPDFKDYIRTIT